MSYGRFLTEQKGYRAIFRAHNPPGPWRCHFAATGKCKHGGVVQDDPGTRSPQLVIHHLDLNHSNDDPANLVPAHHGCHVSHHAPERTRAWLAQSTPEQRQAIARHARLSLTPQERSAQSREAGLIGGPIGGLARSPAKTAAARAAGRACHAVKLPDGRSANAVRSHATKLLDGRSINAVNANAKIPWVSCVVCHQERRTNAIKRHIGAHARRDELPWPLA